MLARPPNTAARRWGRLFHVLLTRTHIRGQCARSALQPVLTGGISEDMGEGKRARRDSEPAASVQSLDLLYSSSPLLSSRTTPPHFVASPPPDTHSLFAQLRACT